MSIAELKIYVVLAKSFFFFFKCAYSEVTCGSLTDKNKRLLLWITCLTVVVEQLLSSIVLALAYFHRVV